MKKQAVLDLLSEQLRLKKARLENMILDLQQSAAEDSKSSMGDKYETSREMTRQEIVKVESRLSIVQQQEIVLQKVAAQHNTEQVRVGNLIETNEGFFFLGIPVGALKIKAQPVFCLSSESPLGKVLIGKTEGEAFVFRGKRFQILEIQ